MVFIIALSLSMDAFSLAVAYGISNYKFDYLKTSIIVGIFHFIMPLIGFILGKIFASIVYIEVNFLIGIILLTIGADLLIESKKSIELKILSNMIEIILFAFAVSLDSFTVGIGLEAITKSIIYGPLIFSVVSFSLTYIGFIFGGIIGEKIGNLSKFISAILLIILGIIYIAR